MKKLIKTRELYEKVPPYLKELFERYEYPYEILPNIAAYARMLLEAPPDRFIRYSHCVLIGENVKIHSSAVIEGPAIIGDFTEIRTGAYLRGAVITGKNCVIGNSSEIKNTILLDYAALPHYNYAGDSIIGSHAHMGAGAICSNLKSDKTNVTIHGETDMETGLRKVGAFIGDNAEIGCGCVLNPGTVIGRNTSVYPLTALRGVYPENCIVKTEKEIVKRL